VSQTRVYRLDVIYPEGCRLPGWHPAAWDDPEYLRSVGREQRRRIRALRRRPFRWPRERLFLSSSGAYGRALLLRALGCDVQVRASLPVEWPAPDDGAWDLGETAARWHPALDAEAWMHEQVTMYQAPVMTAVFNGQPLPGWDRYSENCEAADVQDR